MIRYYCDICKKAIPKQFLQVVTFAFPSRDVKENFHFCQSCKDKVKSYIFECSTREELDEVIQEGKVESKSNTSIKSDVATHILKHDEEALREKTVGIDLGKLKALVDANWAEKEIIGEIDFNRKDDIQCAIDFYKKYGFLPIRKNINILPKSPGMSVITEKQIEQTANSVTGEMEEKEDDWAIKARMLPTDSIEEFVDTQRNTSRWPAEKKISYLMDYCTSKCTLISIITKHGISYAAGSNLGKAYKDFLNGKGVTIPEEAPLEGRNRFAKLPYSRDISTDSINDFLGGLKADRRTPIEKRRALLIEFCTTGESVYNICVKLDINYPVGTKLIDKYIEYIKE